MPDLAFAIRSCEPLRSAAAPTLQFTLHVTDQASDERIRSILLRVQVRIEPIRRHYGADAELPMSELFGDPSRWGATMNGLQWSDVTLAVPAFEGSVDVDLPMQCTYDFAVASAKYFDALGEGDAPLLFLFSGTVFYEGQDGRLQIAPISWDRDARFRMPVRCWRETMDLYFPGSAWIRLSKGAFDQLNDYRIVSGLQSWDDAVVRLLNDKTYSGTEEHGGRR